MPSIQGRTASSKAASRTFQAESPRSAEIWAGTTSPNCDSASSGVNLNLNESLGTPTAGAFDAFADVEAATAVGGFFADAALTGATAGDVAASVAASSTLDEAAAGRLRACRYCKRKLRKERDKYTRVIVPAAWKVAWRVAEMEEQLHHRERVRPVLFLPEGHAAKRTIKTT